MVDKQTVICPRCGHENDYGAANCAGCQINLTWALEQPAGAIRRVGDVAPPPEAVSPRRSSVGLSIVLGILGAGAGLCAGPYIGSEVDCLGSDIRNCTSPTGIVIGLLLGPIVGFVLTLVITLLVTRNRGSSGSDLPETAARSTNPSLEFLAGGWLVAMLLMSTVGMLALNEPSSGPRIRKDESPAWSPDGTQIVFISNRDHDSDIYVMNADGSNITRLTNNPTTTGHPAWSPDGAHIAFDASRGVDAEIFLMDADGSHITRLGLGSSPSWSPDGKHIAVDSSHDLQADVYVRSTDGPEQIRLTRSSAYDGKPAWSPDGARIVYTCFQDDSYDICVMDADGSNVTNLTRSPARDQYAAWSPDGARIVFASNRDGGSDIYIMDADGTSVVRLTDDAAIESHPVWSPDGRRIAFELTTSNGGIDIYVINADGSNRTVLTSEYPSYH